MAKFRFNLRDKKTPTKEVPLYLIVEVKKKKILKYPTGVKIRYEFWNDKSEVVRKSHVAFDRHNQKISQLRNLMCKTFAEYEATGEVLTGYDLRKILDGATNKHKTHDGTICSFMRLYNEKLTSQVNPKTNRLLSKQTISKFKCLLNALLDLEKRQNRVYTFQHLDIDFYHVFMNYLQDVKKYQPNTIGSKYIDPLKQILNEAEKQDIKVNKAYKNRAFATPNEQTDTVYLTIYEIDSMEKLDLSGNQRLERVRDLFLLGYYTGQRFGDFSNFNKAQFQQGKDDLTGLMKLVQNKTAKRVVISVEQNFINIMEKYNWKIKTISGDNFREYIKEVCKLAGIDDMISQTKTYGKEKITTVRPKYELVGSHTARRSYITNALLQNPNMRYKIMEVSGHLTEKEFNKYNKLTAENSAIITGSLLNKVQTDGHLSHNRKKAV